jgi:hypothetical protein
MILGGNFSNWRFSPAGDYVVYIADERSDGVNELFIRQLAGGTTHKKLN